VNKKHLWWKKTN